MPTPSSGFFAEFAVALAHSWWIYVAFIVAAVCAAIGRSFRICLFCILMLGVLLSVQIYATGYALISETSTDASRLLVNK